MSNDQIEQMASAAGERAYEEARRAGLDPEWAEVSRGAAADHVRIFEPETTAAGQRAYDMALAEGLTPEEAQDVRLRTEHDARTEYAAMRRAMLEHQRERMKKAIEELAMAHARGEYYVSGKSLKS